MTGTIGISATPNLGKLSFFIPLTKRDDEQRMAYGYATTEAIDSEGEIITKAAVEGALDGYMKFANIREMHQLSAVGVAKEAEMDEKGLYIGAKVVDDAAWNKVKEGVYKGFSIGGKATARDTKNAKIITGLELIEISLVDRPANPEAIIEVFKAADADKTETEQDPADELRKVLIDAVNALPPDQLEKAVAAFKKRGEAPQEPEPEPEPAGPNAAIVAVKANAILRTDLGAVETLSALATALGCDEATALASVDKAFELYDATGSAPPPALVELKARVSKTASAPKPGTKPESKKADDSDNKPYGDVEYADPGYQEDGKKRYPIDTEKHIRAAWNYINKEKNQSPYSADQLKNIKARIVSAWKKHIDKEGPPSAKAADLPHHNTEKTVSVLQKLGAPDAKGNLQKGLMTVCCAIGLLERLDRLQEALVIEAATEKDNSPMPGRFSQVVSNMSELVQQLLEEEVQEMLEDREAEDFSTSTICEAPCPVYLAATAVKMAGADANPKKIAARLEKMIGDNTGAPGFTMFSEAAELLDKADPSTFSASEGEQTDDWGTHGKTGTQPSNDDWVRRAQSIHDMATAMGATCKAGKKDDKEEDDEEDKAAKPDPKKTEKPEPKKAGKKPPPPKKGKDDEEDDEEDDGDDEGDDEEEDGKKPKKAAKPVVAAQIVGPDMSPVLSVLKAMHDELIALRAEQTAARRDPPRPAKGTLKVVSKTADTITLDNEQPTKEQTPDDILRAALSNPNFVRP